MIQRFEQSKTYFTAYWTKKGIDGPVYSCDCFTVTGRKKLTKENSYSTGNGFSANLHLEIFNSALITINTVPNNDFSSKASEMKELIDQELSFEIKENLNHFMIRQLFLLPYEKLYFFNGIFHEVKK